MKLRTCSAIVIAVVAAVSISVNRPACAGEGIDWSGLYVGGHGGGAWKDLHWQNATPLPGGSSQKFDGTASFAGGHVGLQHQIGPWVIGGEASLSGGNFDKTAFDRSSGAAYRTDISWITTVSGKLGYAVGPWLLSAKAGYAHADISGNGQIGQGGSFRLSGGHAGFTAGAGLEYALTSGIIIGVGYDWLDLAAERRTAVSSLGGLVSATVTPGSIQAATTRVTFKLTPEARSLEPLK